MCIFKVKILPSYYVWAKVVSFQDFSRQLRSGLSKSQFTYNDDAYSLCYYVLKDPYCSLVGFFINYLLCFMFFTLLHLIHIFCCCTTTLDLHCMAFQRRLARRYWAVNLNDATSFHTKTKYSLHKRSKHRYPQQLDV